MGVGHLNNAAKFIDDNAVFIACAEEAKRSGKYIERILRDAMLASPRWIQEHQMSTKGKSGSIRAGKVMRKASKVSRTMQTLSDQIAAEDSRRSTVHTARPRTKLPAHNTAGGSRRKITHTGGLAWSRANAPAVTTRTFPGGRVVKT